MVHWDWLGKPGEFAWACTTSPRTHLEGFQAHVSRVEHRGSSDAISGLQQMEGMQVVSAPCKSPVLPAASRRPSRPCVCSCWCCMCLCARPTCAVSRYLRLYIVAFTIGAAQPAIVCLQARARGSATLIRTNVAAFGVRQLSDGLVTPCHRTTTPLLPTSDLHRSNNHTRIVIMAGARELWACRDPHAWSQCLSQAPRACGAVKNKALVELDR